MDALTYVLGFDWSHLVGALAIYARHFGIDCGGLWFAHSVYVSFIVMVLLHMSLAFL